MTANLNLPGRLEQAVAGLAESLRANVVEVHTPAAGHGAGTIWRSDGTIVTNHHVVPRDQAEVILADGRRLPARVVGRDPRNDLAVLEVPASDLPAVPVGDASALRRGGLVIAGGPPFGLR